MSEVNWDLAPEGADSLKQSVSDNGILQWFKGLDVYLADGKYANTITSRWKTIATRPTQTKTVEDAVEFINELGGWSKVLPGFLYWHESLEWQFHVEGKDKENRDWKLVCTREQFEACAAKKCEKWTHTYCDQKCRIIHTDAGASWIVIDKKGSEVVPTNGLKPIKPTITKEQHLFLCKFASDSDNLEVVAEVESYLAKHDII